MNRAALVLFFVLPLCNAAAAQGNRSELENVVFYQRLVEGGCGLAYKTYAAQERAFADAKRTELAQSAAFFQALAAIELNQPNLADEALQRYTWSDQIDWQKVAAALQRGMRSPARQSQSLSIAEKRAAAGLDPNWRDPDPGSLQSASDKQNAAATWARTGQFDALREIVAEVTLTPSMTILADGKVIVEYDFYDPALFRIEAAKHTDKLYRKLADHADSDTSLVSLWCQIYLLRYDEAQATIELLKQLAIDRQLDRDQIEELQFLGAAVADRLNQTEQVEQFLSGRIQTPPQSPWARGPCI